MMEFGEKLQELRKAKGLTQEELAQALFVSRAAVSKWESGRGYPNIDSLKDISAFFAVSVDDLLSGETLLGIAETQSKTHLRLLYARLWGILDLFTFLFAVLPLYPHTVDGMIFCVPIWQYSQVSGINIAVYCILFVLLFAAGFAKLVCSKANCPTGDKAVSAISFVLSVFAVVFLVLAREVYAALLMFLFFVAKVALRFAEQNAKC